MNCSLTFQNLEREWISYSDNQLRVAAGEIVHSLESELTRAAQDCEQC